MRRLASPVTVVTSCSESEIRGITIGSFASTSLEPALVSFNLSRETPMLPLLEKASAFAVHFLRSDQVSLSEAFAVPDRSGDEQFVNVSYHLDQRGLPVLDNVLARLVCTVEALFAAGDHTIVLGRVGEVYEGEPGEPLVYFKRGYHTVGDALSVSTDLPSDGDAADTP